MGIVPHQIRGEIGLFQMTKMTSIRSLNCTACSPSILKALEDYGNDFILKICSNPLEIEKKSGLNLTDQFQTEELEIISWGNPGSPIAPSGSL